MATSHCKFPDHHTGPSAGPPFGLLAAIAIGAVIIAVWHSIVVVLAILVVLASIAGAVFLLIHNHGSGYDPELEREAARRETAAAVTATVAQQMLEHRVGQLERDAVSHRVGQLEREITSRRVDAIERQQLVRAEIERAVTQAALEQQTADRQALPAGAWQPNQGMR